MALSGQAKTDYQREYMRRRRSNAGSNIKPTPVRPVIPGQPVVVVIPTKGRPKPQSHSPMMAGYVPPKETV